MCLRREYNGESNLCHFIKTTNSNFHVGVNGWQTNPLPFTVTHVRRFMYIKHNLVENFPFYDFHEKKKRPLI